MVKYIREIQQILSVTLVLLVFPHLVLAKTAPLNKIIDQKIAQMTLEEKIGQLFIVGFPQKTISPELEKFISEYKPGSFLLFKRNIHSSEQIRDLNASLYRTSFKYSKLPPLIAIDQEGGSVSRLPITPAPPNAFAIGQTQSPLLAEEMGYQTGLFLREVGFNMNLAPVLDVSDPLSGSFIGVRSFGSDPQIVGELGVAYSQGLLKARVIPTAKHFPGTGNLKADPHVSVVRNSSTLQSLKEKDLKPYEAYTKLGNKIAVMLSHLIYPSLDDSREPASFSKKISTDLLRKEMHYAGLVVTDDLQMQGSKQLLRPEAAALKALQAGADIVMLTWSFADQGKAFEYVKKAVENGELSIDDLHEKLRRILVVKAFANLYRRNPAQPSLLQGPQLTSSGYQQLESTILEKNLATALIPRTLPAKVVENKRRPSSVGSVCVLAATQKFLRSFSNATKRPAKLFTLADNSDKNSVTEWITSQRCDHILFAVTGPKIATLAKSLQADIRKKSIVINLGSPRLFARQNVSSLRVMQLYFNHQDSGKKVAEHLDEILLSSNPNIALK